MRSHCCRRQRAFGIAASCLVLATLADVGSSDGFAATAPTSPVQVIPTGRRNIWRVAAAELDGAREDSEIVGAGYDGRVTAWTGEGKLLRDTARGAFVFDLAARDIDGDGRDEIFAAQADGLVSAYGPDGATRWTVDLRGPVYQVMTARLDGKTWSILAAVVSQEIVVLDASGRRLSSIKQHAAVRLLCAVDFDGDGRDEIVVYNLVGGLR